MSIPFLDISSYRMAGTDFIRISIGYRTLTETAIFSRREVHLTHTVPTNLVYERFHPDDLSQLWHFIHLNEHSQQVAIQQLHTKRNQFLQAQCAYHLVGGVQQANNSPPLPLQNPLQYTGPNLCGDPTCGVTHICSADYNRHVQAFGYPGV